jgi:hypothetical protein
MSTKKAKPETPDLKVVAEEWSELKELSGSDSGYFTLALVNQVWRSLYRREGTAEWILQLGERAARDALKGIAPRDPLEGMLAAQMVATHETAMDCFRRAQVAGQTFEGRRQNLEFANKLVRSYATLLEALNKHRGKGQQVVRVEHVTVQAGGQAIVGAVSQGGGDGGGSDERSHAKGAAALAHAPECPLRCPDPQGDPVPLARGER